MTALWGSLVVFLRTSSGGVLKNAYDEIYPLDRLSRVHDSTANCSQISRIHSSDMTETLHLLNSTSLLPRPLGPGDPLFYPLAL